MYTSVHNHLFREVLECFIKQELLEWSTFQSAFGALLREGLPDDPATDVFTPGSAKGDEHWEDFKKRVTEHVSFASNLLTHT